eukprot:224429_1
MCSCTVDHLPVRCGKYRPEYDNICNVECAGWQDKHSQTDKHEDPKSFAYCEKQTLLYLIYIGEISLELCKGHRTYVETTVVNHCSTDQCEDPIHLCTTDKSPLCYAEVEYGKYCKDKETQFGFDLKYCDGGNCGDEISKLNQRTYMNGASRGVIKFVTSTQHYNIEICTNIKSFSNQNSNGNIIFETLPTSNITLNTPTKIKYNKNYEFIVFSGNILYGSFIDTNN